MPFNYETPTRADIIDNAEGSIFKLAEWFDKINLPIEAREAIYSDLESYNYEEE